MKRGYEGVVAKDEDSRYRSGPSRSWLKVKIRHEGAFLVGGIATTAQGFAGVLGGRREHGQLRHLGTVEFGHSARSIEDLMKRAAKLVRATSPFADLRAKRGVTWLDPRLLGEVIYAEIVGGRLPGGGMAWPPSAAVGLRRREESYGRDEHTGCRTASVALDGRSRLPAGRAPRA